jgi:PPOX class probable F420-dependent enzyme
MAELTPEVRGLFEGANFAHVASLMPDGSPHAVAVWVGTEGDRVHFFTQTGSQKARNLERDPRVAFSIVDGEKPYRSARLRGHVVEIRRGDEALAAMDKMALRYTGQPFPVRGPNGVLFVVELDRAAFTELPFEHRPAR